MILVRELPLLYQRSVGFISNRRLQRLAFALFIASVAVAFLHLVHSTYPDSTPDFSAVWHGAKILSEGGNPYALIGPGREVPLPWELHYPATTLVAAIPITFIPEYTASLLFVFGSSFALAYGSTKKNWNLVWIFPSAAWIIGARAAQWSPLIASGYFLPLMTPLLFLKPTTGFAVMSTWGERRPWIITGIFALTLVVISFLTFPGWFGEFLGTTMGQWEFTSPIMRPGGFLLALSLLKWRQKEARFLFVLSLVPAVPSWYEGLLPMLVARTKRECQLLSLTSSFGYLLLIPLAFTYENQEFPIARIRDMMTAFCDLPALIVVLHNRTDSRLEEVLDRR
jgi:hypothetical protein